MKDSADIRKINTNKIRQLLWKGGQYTKQNIALTTGLSVATCNTLLNDMEQNGEVIGERKRLQKVGRSTVLYQINESFENILCITFEMIKGVKTLNSSILSTTGTILDHTKMNYDYLDYLVIAEHISNIITHYMNISQVMIGTPSIAEHGIIRHCDIPELENETIVKKLATQFNIPVYLENDMHFKVYGYYKKCGNQNDVITLANFPSHILPGTASIHAGTVIKGNNQFAGMVGFLPYGVDRNKELELLEKSTCLPLITNAVSSIIAIINPSKILFTGDLIDEDFLECIKKECLNTIPKEYMPFFFYQDNLDVFYLEGMYQKALELKGDLLYDRT